MFYGKVFRGLYKAWHGPDLWRLSELSPKARRILHEESKLSLRTAFRLESRHRVPDKRPIIDNPVV